MGRGSFLGGGTIVHAGTGFFSHKGGPGRKKAVVGDEPGMKAKPGSICSFPLVDRTSKRKAKRLAKALGKKTAGK